jgi:hypothetical protein
MIRLLPDPVRIEGVDLDGVGEPRNDGTAGSALYAVPIKLNMSPPATWARLFPANWNHPPQWSTRHQPGIARVVGDRIVLSDTTIEEVRDVHAETLKLAVEATNAHLADHEARELRAREAEAERHAAHARNVRDVADGIRFN